MLSNTQIIDPFDPASLRIDPASEMELGVTHRSAM